MSKKALLIVISASLLFGALLWVLWSGADPGTGVAPALEGTRPGSATKDDFPGSVVPETEPVLPQKDASQPPEPTPPEQPLPMGKVLDARGRPVPGVRVSVEEGKSPCVESDEKGCFPLPCLSGDFNPSVALPYVLVRTEKEVSSRGLLLVVARGIDVIGTVIEEDGSPLAGVTIEAPALPLVDFPGILDRTAPSKTAPVQTDAQGGFELKALPNGCAELRFNKAGYAALALPVNQEIAGYQQIVLHPLAKGMHILTGTVVDPLASRIPGARVGIGEHQTRTDSSGEFSLKFPRGSVFKHGKSLYAAKPGYRTKVIPDFGSSRADLEQAHLEIRLEGRTLQISGRILDAAGYPIANAVLTLWDEPFLVGRLTAEDLALPEEITPPEELPSAQKAFGETDASGAFVLKGLSDRSYRIRIFDKEVGFAMTSRPIRAGSRNVVIKLPADAFREKLAGRVVDRHGEPVPGVSLCAFMESKKNGIRSNWTGFKRTRSGKDGSFELPHLCRLDDVMLSLSGEDILSKNKHLAPDAPDTGILIEVEERCRFRIELSDPGLANRFYLLDGQGQEVEIYEYALHRRSTTTTLPLHDGKTEVLTTSDRAVTMVLVGKSELHVPLWLVPEEITVVRR